MSKWAVEANSDTIATIEFNYPVQFLPERTCRNFGGEEGTNGEDYDFACGSCGFRCDGLTNPNYCPKCGAKVVE